MSNLIPDGWNECRLKDVSTVITKGTTPTTYGSGYTQSGIKFIRVENISSSGFINENDLKFISVETHETLKRSQLQAGDLLVSIAGAIGRSAIVGSKNIPANTNQAVGIVRLRSDEIIADFARYSIESPVVAKQISDSQAGNAQVNLNLEQLGGLCLYRPPLTEQQKIATILSSVDDVIEKTRAQIDKLKDLKTGMMQELLTKGIGHTEFKDSPVGSVPVSWNVVSFFDAVSIQSGQVDPKETKYKNLILIAPNHVESETGRLIKMETAVEQSSISGKFLCKPGTLIYSKIRPRLKKAVLVDFECLCSADMYPLVCKDSLVADFLKHLILDERFSLFAATVSERSNIPKINRTELAEFVFALPSVEEQIEIAKIICSVEDKYYAAYFKLEGLIGLKKALMQDLLTGKVRVKLTDKESAVV